MAIHVSTTAHSELELERRAGFSRGKVALRELAEARRLSEVLREGAGVETGLSAADLSALSRIEEVFQLLVSRHLRERDPALLEDLLQEAERGLGEAESRRLLGLFGADFSLRGGRDLLLRELLVWWVLDDNPAAEPAIRRLSSGAFRSDPGRLALLRTLERRAETGEGGSQADLFDLLRAPARAAPESLTAQLRYIAESWSDLVGVDWTGVLRTLDLAAEESKRASFGEGPGPAEVPAFRDLEAEPENFSADQDWMPAVVMLAKNAYVWLDQLSKRFGRPIQTLDAIPSEVLDEMADRGFTTLWLIGVWERSVASERLKRMCGNPEAVASAYSLKGYRIASALGGEGALTELRRRAGERGIRLAADMVPNHFGLDSDWLLEHPDRFLSLPESPFAAYTFEGHDFSPDPRIGVYVEDRYFDRSDAAVVFQRVDRETGDVRYVYHGNDGTSMPWNDTAQLNYLNPETREAVILTILEVARRFPVIRFDAAMTLARRHFQRLWFPAPGSGGAVPSRTEHGLSAEEFARLMPEEFWREVVDRVAEEAPDTLLLAEAFWLMEGYFVRSLGMHRVYNSAFMNMLRDGENAKYRRLIKETLGFDPRILLRYVNFLTNPDERTALDQFGRDDRYFGACVLLATLPGLPMFGHGQIEGFAEKYGMEYRRAYHDESPDAELVARHQREIVPLLRRRRALAGVRDFELYDFVAAGGDVDENVLAYSNGVGDDRILVVFNNADQRARGRLRHSAPRESRPGRTLAVALGLDGGGDSLWHFRDRIRGLSYLRRRSDWVASGLELELDAFQYGVFADFHQLEGEARRRFDALERRLGGRGVPSLEEALAELELEPAHRALTRALVALAGTLPPPATDEERPGAVPGTGPIGSEEEVGELFADAGAIDGEESGAPERGEEDEVEGLQWLEELPEDSPPASEAFEAAGTTEPGARTAGPAAGAQASDEEGKGVVDLAARVRALLPGVSDGGEGALRRGLGKRLAAVAALGRFQEVIPFPETDRMRRGVERITGWVTGSLEVPLGLGAAAIFSELEASGVARPLLERLAAGGALAAALDELEEAPAGGDRGERLGRIVRLLWRRGWLEGAELPGSAELKEMARRWSLEPEIQGLIGFHRSEDGEWIRQDELEELADWRLVAAVATALRESDDPGTRAESVVGWFEAMGRLRERARSAGYRAEGLRGQEPPPGASGPPADEPADSPPELSKTSE